MFAKASSHCAGKSRKVDRRFAELGLILLLLLGGVAINTSSWAALAPKARHLRSTAIPAALAGQPNFRPWSLGNYPDTSLQLGGNTTINPDDGPIGTISINVSTSTSFKGKLEGNPVTGVVRVTDAHPEGVYTVKVTGFDGIPSVKTFILTVTTPAICNPTTYPAAANFNINPAPQSVAVGDFNGDGRQDLVTANNVSNNVAILLGDAVAGFGPPTNITVGNGPLSVAIGDFNGDGKQDIAAANFNAANVSVLLGNGTGGFGAATNFAANVFPYFVTVGDFNGDARQDLVVANLQSSIVSVLLGNGAGSFSAPTTFNVGSQPRSIAVGDFNNDGNQDLAVADNNTSEVSILLGNGTGNFGGAASFSVGTNPQSVALGDFNHDGKQDLAVSNNGSNNVSILIGNGNGGFGGATNFNAGAQAHAIVVADFDGDANEDLAVVNSGSDNVSILLANGPGTFSAATNFTVGSIPVSLAVGDFNGDGMIDLAATNANSSGLSILLRQCQTTTIEVNSTADSGPASLRQAIVDANAMPGVQTIVFGIPGPGVQTFIPATPYPDITDAIIINGYTQPGASANTKAEGDDAVLLIEISGNGGAFNGFNITGGGSTVRGLVINGFGSNGSAIRLSGGSGNTIEGCFLGTNPTGVTAKGNASGVAVLASAGNLIGGATVAKRNIISGNRVAGIQIGDLNQSAAEKTSIVGNYIGTTANGIGALGNGQNSAAGGNGIVIPANAKVGTIQRNRIAYNTGNVATDTGNGIRLLTPTGGSDFPAVGIQISENEIFGNDGLGIDLGSAGVTSNDPLDADAGPNNLQNFPGLTSYALVTSNLDEFVAQSSGVVGRASLSTSSVTVNGNLNSTANQTFIVDWYFSASPQCAANQSGARPLAFGRVPGVTTNASGDASFAFPFEFPSGTTSGVINCTATDSLGNTSEFSACLPVSSSPPPTMQLISTGNTVSEGAGSATITVARTGSSAGVSAVDFAVTDGSANQSQDYVVTSGTLSFAAGETSKSFLILIVDDAFIEGSEALNLTLSNATGGTLGAPATATLTITDNDSVGSTSPVAKRFGAMLDGGQETPPNSSTGKGTGYVLLNGAETSAQVGLQFQNLGSAEVSAHIHSGSVGVAGPILFTLAPPIVNPIVNMSISPNAQQVADLKAGLHYFNVHSTNFPNGEIRGQLRWNPTLEENFFVRQQYLDFLSRDGDPSGFNFWVGTVSCQADAQCWHDRTIITSNAFFFEPEFQQTAGYVFRVYRAAYGNTQPFPNPDGSNATEANKLIDYSAFVADRARVVGGADLAAAQVAFANLFVARSQFTTRYGAGLNTAALFVDAILASIQTSDGVNLTGRQTLIDQYNSAGGGNAGRAQVLYRLADDNAQNPLNNQAFINAEYNRQFALTLYFGYLRRNPDIGGFLFWQSQINSAPLRNVDKQNALVCSFLTAAEYQFRFGPNAPRSNAECPQ